mmetsp:Transcript_148864/g.478212  ORF Transcript_148864/g.478212 Transcript_148864/m.478212 type:complete len:375 (+) Transcript_148864:1892-3016(+)
MGLKPTNLVLVYPCSFLCATCSPKCSLTLSNTALSMGSSLFAGLEAMPAQSSASSGEKPLRVQTFDGSTRISAVVRVPVLSEQSTDIEATSCKAVRCVTMACFLAIFAAPIAIVTCITKGRAIGTAPMTSASTFNSESETFRPRVWTLTYITTPASTRDIKMTKRITCMILVSKIPIWWPEDSWTKPAACPISERRPVSFTRQCPSPCLMMQPPRRWRPAPSSSPSRSGRGTFRGMGSPVSAAVSTSMGSPSNHSLSAGTMLPPRRKMTSPGTSSATGKMTMVPSRFVGQVAVIEALRASKLCFALCSSWKPMKAFTTSMSTITPKSGQSSTTAETMAAISNMKGIMPMNCFPSMKYQGSMTSGISLRPNSTKR